ncbi:MAG: PDZ domain-containing protein [Solirubrobacteraceae bacterium]
MSGPKHLWSGDWQSESVPPAQTPPPAEEQQPEAVAQLEPLFTKRQIALAIGAGIATAAVTLALVTAFSSSPKPRSHSHTHTHAAAKGTPRGSGGKGLTTPTKPAHICQQGQAGCTTSAATSPLSGPTADWLGMQIVTTPTGVVVDTVALGSPADVAGFEPGDQIMSVDTHVVGTVFQLRSDTASVKLGAPVTIAILRSSVQLTLTSIPLTQRPTIHP